ncbi:hypothetical protein J437_LFUL018839 [Ladona fulva]|uniref:RNA-directed DNA polymerase n=1 Tax=Ladona fulva TaxID=123851 RepID=A0A8K0KRS0_LADFU|nr:hypothetical protein J437_LFUL018839 [Ladona fulva]
MLILRPEERIQRADTFDGAGRDYCAWYHSREDPSSRLTRWSLLLSEYDFDIQHRPGKAHQNADALSRSFVRAFQSAYEPTWDRDLIREEQKRDEFCQKILKELREGGDRRAREFKQDEDGLLYRKNYHRHDQLVAPRNMRNRILRAFHDAPWAGHMGVKRTLASIRSKFWWSTIRKDVEEYCENCVSCQERKNPRGPQRAPLQPLPEVTTPLQRVSMDIIGLPFTYKGTDISSPFRTHLRSIPKPSRCRTKKRKR